MNRFFIICQILLFACLVQFSSVEAHGRLMDPIARGSRWRTNSSAPKDYDDNQGWCGGYTIQHDKHKGNCGLCGNTYSDPTPRNHEFGGIYGEGVIVQTYKTGSVIVANVDLTANHWGYFKFDLCNLGLEDETEQCFAKYKLKLSTGEDSYKLLSHNPGFYKVSLQLPQNLDCEHCVLRWTYTAANRWGMCEDGTGKNGCGPQETFVGCSDISIAPNFDIDQEIEDDDSFEDELAETLESLEELLDLSGESNQIDE